MQVEVIDDDDFRTGRATVIPVAEVQVVRTSSSSPGPEKSIQGTMRSSASAMASSLRTSGTTALNAMSSAGDSLIKAGNDGLAALSLDDEAIAAAAKIQAIYRGNIERAQVQSQLLYKRMVKTGQLFNINFLGSPVSSTIKSSLDVGSPPGASIYERTRDFILAKMVTLSPLFLVISVIGAIGVVGFGLFLLVLLFPVNFGLQMGDFTTYLYPECNSSAYNASLVLSHTKPNYPPRIVGVGLDIMDFGLPHYVSYECTLAQRWFNLCIKYFTLYFTYVNFLPLPWTTAIFINSQCPNQEVVKAGGSGVDFYGRPSESLWFHLPGKARRGIAFWLLFALVSQACAVVFHLYYFSYLAGQTWPGALLQNVWLVFQFGGQIRAGILQGRAEKQARLDHPKRFPPTFDTYVKAAFQRWRSEAKRQSKSPRLLCGEDSFIKFLLEEARQFKEETQKYGKIDALTGISIVALNEKVINTLELKAKRDLNGDGAVSTSPQGSPHLAPQNKV